MAPKNELFFRNAKAETKPFKISDGGGLHRLVQPHGSKLWRLAYRFDGKQKLLSFGTRQSEAGGSKYVFPSVRSGKRPMSENTLNAALRRLGYSSDEMTAHGFRSMASTRLNESGQFSPDVIERQLAHQEQNEIRRAYNSAEHLPERTRMMQYWADYLDELRAVKAA